MNGCYIEHDIVGTLGEGISVHTSKVTTHLCNESSPAGYLSPMAYVVFPNTVNRGMGESPQAFKRESWRERVGSMS